MTIFSATAYANRLFTKVGFFTGMLDIQPHPSQLQELFADYSRYDLDLDLADLHSEEFASER